MIRRQSFLRERYQECVYKRDRMVRWRISGPLSVIVARHFQKLVNMKILQLALALIMLSLQETKAQFGVTSCIQCESLPGKENAACIAGTVNGN